MQGFSIIICSYNPTKEIIGQLLNSILKFETSSFDFEVIIVDNNSSPALASFENVKYFLKLFEFSTILIEKKPGLTSARLAGINASKFDWIVFFDDDNEPETDYLLQVEELVRQYPKVGTWGPGTIDVEYLFEPNDWLQKNKSIFQQRTEKQITFDLQPQWQSCYPNGTGMVIKREIAEEYVTRVVNERYTMSDRKGKSLSSGGDVQIVLTGIQLGFFAGVAPALRLKHIIEYNKTKFKYLRKLIYGTNSSYIKAYNQVFENSPFRPSAPSNLVVLKLCWYYYKQSRQQKDIKSAILALTAKLGEFNAGLLYNNNLRKPLFLKIFESLLL